MPKPIAFYSCILGALFASSTKLRVSIYPGTIKVSCVGDGITYGSGVEKREVNCA